MKSNLFEGQIVRLRAVEEEDWQSFREMDLDSETARCADQIPFPGSSAASHEWAKAESLKKPQNDAFRFVIEHLAEGKLAGTINTHSIEQRNGTFGYGLAVHPDYRRMGCASEAILLLLNYFFKELRYQKCTISVFGFNPASYELHRKLGFVQEGRLRRMEFSNGHYYDHFVFGMTAEEFTALHGEKFERTLPRLEAS